MDNQSQTRPAVPTLDAKSVAVREKTVRGLVIAMVSETCKILCDRTVLGAEEMTLFDAWQSDLVTYIKAIGDREKAIAYIDPAQYVEQQIKQTITAEQSESNG